MSEKQSDAVVALDLGSNSFHLLEARCAGRQMELLDTRRKKVQLALGMVDGLLTEQAIARGLACIEEYAPLIKHRPANRVRIVATQALRLALNRADFCEPAELILGHPVEIIDGEQEAELVFKAVCHSTEFDLSKGKSVLVVDIGGGSTELVKATGSVVEQALSIPVGCVSLLDAFTDGSINTQSIDRAYRLARKQFDSVADKLVNTELLAIGCSGTLIAVEKVMVSRGWSAGGINRRGLALLKEALLNFEHIDAVEFDSLREDRRNVFASGFSIVEALFDSLQLERMELSTMGLREGVALSLL
jgi:exopolyphosphatase/guanosine-5'-triphosphate,3'-diphosphate pyrophosphatase